MKNIDYHHQLSDKVLPFLTHYQTDFTVTDKKMLAGHTGAFILAMRKSGTNLVIKQKEHLLDFGFPLFDEHNTKPSIQTLNDTILTLLKSNDKFFIGENGHVKKASLKQAINFLSPGNLTLTKFIQTTNSIPRNNVTITPKSVRGTPLSFFH